jgi:hypothetical protein
VPDQEVAARAVSPAFPAELQAALEAIYERHTSVVFSVCGWWLGDADAAMDAAQSAFEIAFGHLLGPGRAAGNQRERRQRRHLREPVPHRGRLRRYSSFDESGYSVRENCLTLSYRSV